MLFIYGALPVGGIETFFLRMAKERHRLGLPVSVLLLSKPEKSDKKMLAEMRQVAKVYFLSDLFYGSFGPCAKFPLLLPIKKETTEKIFSEVNQVHAFDGMHALLGYRIISQLGLSLPITIGFYHYIKYIWGGNEVAHHERINRKFIFDYLPQESLLFFSEGNRKLYENFRRICLSGAQTFRLGVVDEKLVSVSGAISNPLRIVAVGRLVEFKTYNIYMLGVIKKLKENGVNVRLDIYGEGPIQNKVESLVRELALEEVVTLKGTLDYNDFNIVVGDYDLFIGSGTAIIQAAALGVPSIVGVENVISSETYGYFCDVCDFEYNVKGLDLPLVNVGGLIEDYIMLDQTERHNLKLRHLLSVKAFTNESCHNALDSLQFILMPEYRFNFNKFYYEFSRFVDWVKMKIFSNHPFNKRHEWFENNKQDF
ncbi:MAG: glycosyltransferase family 4 protein [Actinobacteria bacterium]|nr:glycosyltransferase family 4 protein [Actinomycetota bacterium]